MPRPHVLDLQSGIIGFGDEPIITGIWERVSLCVSAHDSAIQPEVGRTKYQHWLPIHAVMVLVSIPSERSGMMTSYALTQFGVNFILAVRPKRPSED